MGPGGNDWGLHNFAFNWFTGAKLGAGCTILQDNIEKATKNLNPRGVEAKLFELDG